jgi:cytochrome P450
VSDVATKFPQPLKAKDLADIPGFSPPPIIGNTLKVLADPEGFTNRAHAKFGPVFRNHAFGNWNINLLGPDANELVLFDREKIFSSEQGWSPLLDRLFPRGLMLMDFDEHRVHRKALSVAFKPEPMQHYAQSLNTGIAPRVRDWAGQNFEFYPAIKKLTLDLAATSFLGVDWGPEADGINRAFVDMVAASVAVIRAPLPGTLMARGVKGRQFMLAFFAREIPKRRVDGGSDIFSQLCHVEDENGDLLSDQAIMDHMNFLMMAAHDTLTSSITSMVYLLAKNPEWQSKLRAEHESLGVNDDELPYTKLNDMPLTECVFKESLRLMPPVPGLPRRALKSFDFRGHHIPAGALVNVNPLFSHRMAEHWPDPERFDPLRFLAENSQGRHKYAWVPFGGGAHMCLGLHFAYMQTKIFFFHLLRSHEIALGTRANEQWRIFPIPKPKDGLPVRVTAL